MRLSKREVDIIKETINNYCKNPKIYLFGSRLDDNKKGGDIDIFIISEQNDYETKIKIASKLEYIIDKPVDIIIHKDFNRKIEQEALKGVEL